MTADRTKLGPWWRQLWPSRPPAADTALRGHNDLFKESVAELSRRAAERLAQQATDPAAAAQARRAALQAYDRARARRLRLALGLGVAAIVGSGIAGLVATVGLPPAPPSASAAALAERLAPVEMASATVSPPSQATADLSASVPSPAVEPETAPAAVAADDRAAPVEAPPLQRDEVREVQARLRSLGFNPGPLDGIAGRTTMGAVMHYQQQRSLPQTGNIDGDLLVQLREDPNPQLAQAAPQQVAQRAPRPDARASRSRGARSADPFEPVKEAGNRFGRWLDSLAR